MAIAVMAMVMDAEGARAESGLGANLFEADRNAVEICH